eukprot:1949183-Prorocentrum_lima.AAC.1
MPGRSALQCILTARHLVTLASEWHRPLHILKLDMTKAYDSVPHATLPLALTWAGVPTPLTQAIMRITEG